jgi:hypothetical protein
MPARYKTTAPIISPRKTGVREGMLFLRSLEDPMGRKTALHWWDCSFAWWWGGGKRHGPSHSPRSDGEPTHLPTRGGPILVLLLSLGLWALIWAAFSLLAACVLH